MMEMKIDGTNLAWRDDSPRCCCSIIILSTNTYSLTHEQASGLDQAPNNLSEDINGFLAASIQAGSLLFGQLIQSHRLITVAPAS